MSQVIINNRTIGTGHPTYIIAEMSANHNQNFDAAVELINIAKECGVDAIKIQTYTPDTITLDCDNEFFKIGKGTIWEGQTLHSLYGKAYTPWEWQPKLKKIADDLGLDFFSTPFDDSAVDFLEEMDVPVYKIASFELVDIPLIKKVAATGKPVIMSTGMGTLSEIDEAVSAFRQAGGTDLILLKCTSAYPAPPESMNLHTIMNMQETFGVPCGLSDHSLGIEIPITAVALGACVIEKHFIKSRADGGPDSSFSLEAEELKAMVVSIRNAEKALGKVQYQITEKEKAGRVFRKSIFACKDILKGESLSADNIKCVRPGYGLHTRHFEEIMGKKALNDIRLGTPISWDKLS
ncbi:N-acetylneuraminate synthase [Maridesulfovibrio ferrireducens]|uniref:N-acetylneuraminate synthase n=1 Tax=Maridesulfovibrio ferrireducens TaxID=246191 RepID=A0A1G9CQ26_9BACT|nr:pseudaminic acid synthase [Maridesulfovibrio ferrireducens]SDK53575.1 N-acetylneuraminate synthase [Maridesulfovibrio ferrireducens]